MHLCLNVLTDDLLTFTLFEYAPHVQNRYGLTLVEAKELYRMSGIKGVWLELDQLKAA